MLAQLGEVQFELLKNPGQISESAKWEWAEHKVLDTKPHLQKMGRALVTINMTIKLSAALGYNPQEMIDIFSSEAEKKRALPFILGNGRVIGEFVIEEIGKTWQRTDNKGNLLTAELTVRLKEYG